MKPYATNGYVFCHFGFSNATLVATTAPDAQIALNNSGRLLLYSDGRLKFFGLCLTVITKVMNASRDDNLLVVESQDGLFIFRVLGGC